MSGTGTPKKGDGAHARSAPLVAGPDGLPARNMMPRGAPSDFEKDVANAARLARREICALVADADAAGALAHLLDGAAAETRAPDAQAKVAAFLGDLAAKPPALVIEGAAHLDIEAAEAAGSRVNALSEGRLAAYAEPEGYTPCLLLSPELGYRDMLLTAQAGIAHAVLWAARRWGIVRRPGLRGDDVLLFLRRRADPDAPDLAAPGTPRRPAETDNLMIGNRRAWAHAIGPDGTGLGTQGSA